MRNIIFVILTAFITALNAQVPDKVGLRLRYTNHTKAARLPVDFTYKYGLKENDWLRLRLGYATAHYSSNQKDITFNVGIGWERQARFFSRWAFIYGFEASSIHEGYHFKNSKEEIHVGRNHIMMIGIPLSIEFSVTSKFAIALNTIPCYFQKINKANITGFPLRNNGFEFSQINSIGLSLSYCFFKD